MSEFKEFDKIKRINELEEKLQYIIMKEIDTHEKDLLNENRFKDYIKPTCEKIVAKTGINMFNILSKDKQKALQKEIETDLLPEMNTYIRKSCEKYQASLGGKIKKLLDDFEAKIPEEHLKKTSLDNFLNVSGKDSKDTASAVSKGVSVDMGVSMAGGIGAAISSTFLTTTVTTTYLWIFTTTSTVTNPIGWGSLIVSGIIALASTGSAMSGMEKKIADAVGPMPHVLAPNGILYKIWHEGIKTKKSKTPSMKSERVKDFEKIWKGYDSFKNPVTEEKVKGFEGLESILKRILS